MSQPRCSSDMAEISTPYPRAGPGRRAGITGYANVTETQEYQGSQPRPATRRPRTIDVSRTPLLGPEQLPGAGAGGGHRGDGGEHEPAGHGGEQAEEQARPPVTARRCEHDAGPAVVQYRSADGCFGLQVAATFLVQQASGGFAIAPGRCPGAARQDDRRCPGVSSFRPAGEPDEHDDGAGACPAWLCT